MLCEQTSQPEITSRQIAKYAALAGVLCIAVLVATSPVLPMAWDEGNAIVRSNGVVAWFQLLSDGDANPLSEETIARHWLYTNSVEGHPAFYGIVIAAGSWLSSSWLTPLDGCRFGPMMLFGVAAGAMFYRIAKEYSLAGAVVAIAALMLLPRLFAHAHFASFDSPLVSCWILAWATFAAGRASWRGAIAFGVTLGMTLSCKATGWIAPLPFVVWAVMYRDRAAMKALAIAAPTSLLVFYLLNPPLWHAPFSGLAEFFRLNAHREFNVSTQFLGQQYDLQHPLPWYNSLFLTAVTVPLGTLLLLGFGVFAVARRRFQDRAGVLLLGHWLVLIVVRATPFAPPHDGVRLFLPSFAFLAALAGVGAHWVFSNTGTARGLRHWRCVVALLLLGNATSLLWYMPQWLSYYSLVIGGLPGATAVGMEPTYYWDSLDRSVMDWLEENTSNGEKVLFASAPNENLALMGSWGTFELPSHEDDPGEYRWYVVQRRPSELTDADRWLNEHAKPALQKNIRTSGWGPWRLDVPLLDVYDYRDYVRAKQAMGDRR